MSSEVKSDAMEVISFQAPDHIRRISDQTDVAVSAPALTTPHPEYTVRREVLYVEAEGRCRRRNEINLLGMGGRRLLGKVVNIQENDKGDEKGEGKEMKGSGVKVGGLAGDWMGERPGTSRM